MLTESENRAIKKALRILEEKAVYHYDDMSSAEQAKQYCYMQMTGLTREVFGVVFLTTQNKIIAFEKMFLGTIDSSPVFPREILKRVLELNATSIILTHNHPSGIETPSQADISITTIINDSLRLIDVRVLDHIIVGNSTYSFAENNML